jgi:hypothetical protein
MILKELPGGSFFILVCRWRAPGIKILHIPALVSADGILPGSSSKLRLLVINLVLPAGRQVQFRADSWSIPQPHKAPNVVRNVF